MEFVHSGIPTFYRSIYSVMDHARERGLVFYGAGYWGEVACRIFSLFQVYPACFCDDDPAKQGTPFHFEDREIPIVSLDEAAERFPQAVYIATVTSGMDNARGPMNQRLRERGLLSTDSGFHPLRYLFLLEGGFEALDHPAPMGSDAFTPECIENMVIFNHMSNSGSVLFGNLMDGHPNILNIGIFGNLVILKEAFINRLQYLEGTELVMETASQMTPYFYTPHFPEQIYEGVMRRFSANYYCNERGEIENRIYVLPQKFVAALNAVFLDRGRVSFSTLLKGIYAAYHNAIGKKYIADQPCWIFFMRHKSNYDMRELDGLIGPDDFKRLEYWFIIREPIQHIFSLFKRNWAETTMENLRYMGRPAEYLERLMCDLGVMLEKRDYNRDRVVRVVRFEDVKAHTRETMQAACACLGLPYCDCMEETTANGITVYFPAVGDTVNSSGNSPQAAQGVIAANDMGPLNRRDFSSLLSSYDIFRLNLACQNFRRTYGYGCDVPDYRTFSEAFLEELFREPFRFEPVLDEAGEEAQKYGYFAPGEDPHCHQRIADLFLNYMKQPVHELFTDMIRPAEES